jgi:hypothetical protein
VVTFPGLMETNFNQVSGMHLPHFLGELIHLHLNLCLLNLCPPRPPGPPPPAAKQASKHRPKSPKPSLGYSSLYSNNHQKKSQSRVTAAAIGSATCTVFVLLIVGLVKSSILSIA